MLSLTTCNTANAAQKKKPNLLLSAFLVCAGALAPVVPAKAQQAIDPFVQNPNLAVVVYSNATRLINACYVNDHAPSCYQANHMGNILLNSCQQWGGQSCISYNLLVQMDNNAKMNQSIRRMHNQY